MSNPSRRHPAVADQLEPRRLLSGAMLVLSGSNTYTGGTTVSGGTLQLGSSAGNGTSTGTITVISSGPTSTPPPTTLTLSGRVYYDQAGYGIQESNEPPAVGLTVTLTGDAHGLPDELATTDANGDYLFADLPVGAYAVRLAVPAGMALTEPATGVWSPSVTAGSDGNLDFGLGYAGSLAGTVFADANASGTADAGDAGAVGVTVVATTPGLAQRSYRTTTDSAGGYAFPALPAGFYTVAADLPASQFATAPFGVQYTFGVSAGQPSTAAPIGVAPASAASSIAGSVFYDFDGNGAEGSGDYAAHGPTVYLDLNGNGVRNATEPAVVADQNGNFRFDNLPIGRYVIRTIMPDQYEPLGQTTLSPGSLTTTAGATTQALPIGLGTPPIAGTVRSPDGAARAELTVFLDDNGNGRLDPGETSTTTAVDGTYRFNDLPEGSYIVKQVVPLGERASTPDGGGEHDVDISSDGDPSGDNDFVAETLPAGPLTATIVGRPARAPVAGGHGTVLVRLTNGGRTPFAGLVPVAVYVSADGSVSTQDVADGKVTKSVRLGGGRSVVVAVPVTYPASLAGGEYHLVAAATAAAGDAPAIATIAVSADLAPAIVAPAAGLVLRAGGSMVVVRLTNRGTVMAAGSATVVVSAVSRDGSTLGTVGSTTAIRVRVGAGRSTTVRVRVTPPPGVAAGAYTLVAVVTSVTSPADADADPTDDTSAAVATR